jgi:dimeric dUTPase (all-alpha-NTP-PPase superfamily)
MKLESYYLMQAKLDLNIIMKKGLDPEKPEFMRKRIIAFKQEFGELLQRLPEVFKDWSNKKNILDDETLEEWVDGFHFLLSIGNWKGWAIETPVYYKSFETELDELSICIYESTFSTPFEYGKTFDQYYTFIRTLGYTDEQIEAAYKKKNTVNFERQENNY